VEHPFTLQLIALKEFFWVNIGAIEEMAEQGTLPIQVIQVIQAQLDF
jgi:hypothetical protein